MMERGLSWTGEELVIDPECDAHIVANPTHILTQNELQETENEWT